jgi:hypothetical protein
MPAPSPPGVGRGIGPSTGPVPLLTADDDERVGPTGSDDELLDPLVELALVDPPAVLAGAAEPPTAVVQPAIDSAAQARNTAVRWRIPR